MAAICLGLNVLRYATWGLDMFIIVSGSGLVHIGTKSLPVPVMTTMAYNVVLGVDFNFQH